MQRIPTLKTTQQDLESEEGDGRPRRPGTSPSFARTPPERILVPAVGAIVVALFAPEPLESAVLALLVFLCSSLLVSDRPSWASLLPLMSTPLQMLVPLSGTLGLILLDRLTGLPALSPTDIAVVFVATSTAAVLPYVLTRRGLRNSAGIRTAVIGSERSALDLARELQLAGIPDYVVVGRVSVAAPTTPDHDGEVTWLGELDRLGEIVRAHDVQLLVMSGEAPRYMVFDEVARSCLELPVRLWELSAFYEDVFGHVAVAEINAAWFQYIMHPRYRRIAPISKRALDIVVSVGFGLLFLPILAVVAPIIRRDGGPVFFHQVRIGEGGRPLTMYKLRTMRTESGVSPQWASDDDDRITPIGRFLRKSHLDELPQLLNVFRGQMSVVGPRPEQPEFVERLEEVLPFYKRRHLLKPGLTGWAQVRCGYAGSDVGSAWKLSHDLYYLKHGSMGFDLAILLETFRTLFADRRYAIEPKRISFIHGYNPMPPIDPSIDTESPLSAQS